MTEYKELLSILGPSQGMTERVKNLNKPADFLYPLFTKARTLLATDHEHQEELKTICRVLGPLIKMPAVALEEFQVDDPQEDQDEPSEKEADCAFFFMLCIIMYSFL